MFLGSALPSEASHIAIPRRHQVKPKRPLIKSEVYNDDIDIPPPVKKTHSLQNVNHSSEPPPLPERSPPPLPKSRLPTIALNDEYEYPTQNDVSIRTSYEVPSNSRSVALAGMSVDRNLIKHNGEVEETLEIITKNSLYSYEDDHDSFMQKKSAMALSSTNHYEEMSVGDDPSTLILMTQHSLGSEETEKYSDKNLSDYSYAYASTYANDDEFKVNVVKHDLKSISFSEDEVSNPDIVDDDYTDFNDLGYSSQASSIFFGGDLNPLAVRTKTIPLKGNSESDNEDLNPLAARTRTIALKDNQESDEEDC